jgi:hypothetical protein
MISYELQDFHCMTLRKPGVSAEMVQARAHSQVYSQRYNLKTPYNSTSLSPEY